MEQQESEKSIILVVDDDEVVRRSLGVVITSLGYYCLEAEDGEEAVEVLGSTDCDLVLSDLMMPGMDGLELLAYIGKHYPDISVIIATGYSEQVSYADVINAGATDFIKKPVDQGELEAKLARAFRERDYVKRLEILSMRDELTLLFNRRAFNKRFPEEIDRANRQGWDMYLAIIDIDNFKDYNDTYGHLEGDKVLIAVGKILDECTRQNVDLNYRIGGDEFAVLLPETNADQATEIVQRILLRFVEKNFDKTTLSIGIVSCKRDKSISIEQDEVAIKERADKAMYEAKNSGKNCVICKVK